MSGYVPCACRDCMDIAIGRGYPFSELCNACEEAGCLNYALRANLDYEGGPEFECNRIDAYDDDT